MQLGLEWARALIAADCVPQLESCELDSTADARAAHVAAGLADAAVKRRRGAERGFLFRL